MTVNKKFIFDVITVYILEKEMKCKYISVSYKIRNGALSYRYAHET